MADTLRRVTIWLRVIAVLVLLGFLYVGVRQLIDFYGNKTGVSSERAIYDYFAALSAADYDTVYRLTATDALTDIYGRPVTEAEFQRQLRALTGESPLTIRVVKATRIAEEGDTRFYTVELGTDVGGAPSGSRLLLEVRRQGDAWRVRYPFAIVL
jgi:ketosteroid isomerase-like protein